MACLSRSSYTKRAVLNRLRLVYKRSISFTKLASGVQKWRFVYKYILFNLQTSISSYKLASRITTQLTKTLLAQLMFLGDSHEKKANTSLMILDLQMPIILLLVCTIIAILTISKVNSNLRVPFVLQEAHFVNEIPVL